MKEERDRVVFKSLLTIKRRKRGVHIVSGSAGFFWGIYRGGSGPITW